MTVFSSSFPDSFSFFFSHCSHFFVEPVAGASDSDMCLSNSSAEFWVILVHIGLPLLYYTMDERRQVGQISNI
jgi:hypothetical protein